MPGAFQSFNVFSMKASKPSSFLAISALLSWARAGAPSERANSNRLNTTLLDCIGERIISSIYGCSWLRPPRGKAVGGCFAHDVRRRLICLEKTRASGLFRVFQVKALGYSAAVS